MTHPLLVGLDGVKKMSKSLGNYIGITEKPEEIFGKAMSIPDDRMRDYLLYATDLGDPDIDRLLDPERTHPRDAKEALAKAIVSRYWPAEDAEAAAEAFRRVFSMRQEPTDLPEVRVPAAELTDGRIWIVRLVALAGFAASNGEARRLVKQGAVSIDGEKIEDETENVPVAGGETLRVGRRRFAKLVRE
jgi:tyrosyl-tRNA synthetase